MHHLTIDETGLVRGTASAGARATLPGEQAITVAQFDDAWIGRAYATETEAGWQVALPEAPEPTADQIKAALVVYAADSRWRHEQAGTIWNSWPIHTDAASQGKYLSELQAIALNVRIDGDPWKFADGVFRPVSNEDFPALAIAAREHVRAAFGIEGMLLACIEAGTVSTREQIDAATWPANT